MNKSQSMRITIGVAFFLHLCLSAAFALAQPQDSRLEIDELLLDQTKTRAGHDFFRSFSSSWEKPEGAEAYNIVILENASPQLGSVVWIKVNDRAVFQSLLKPRDADIRELAGKAVERVKDYVRTYLKDGQKQDDEDLAGSGW